MLRYVDKAAGGGRVFWGWIDAPGCPPGNSQGEAP